VGEIADVQMEIVPVGKLAMGAAQSKVLQLLKKLLLRGSSLHRCEAVVLGEVAAVDESV
jgi:hypothetical protein